MTAPEQNVITNLRIRMHLIIVHGYLLQGTGSNIYVANIARAWCRLGHGVTVICQDRQAQDLAFVDEYIGPGDRMPERATEPGRLRVIVPDIDELLPVFVYDHYAGYRVKTIPEMTEPEIERYIDMTALSLRQVAEQGADRVLANHAIFGPVIARRALQDACIPYDVKIHGSAIEYVLAPYPEFIKYAREGLSGADKLFVGTKYMRDRVLQVFSPWDESGSLAAKIRVVPPGMDPEVFHLARAGDFDRDQDRFLEVLKAKIRENPDGRKAPVVPVPAPSALSGEDLHRQLLAAAETYNQRAPDADLLERWPLLQEQEPLILYVGKFLAAKGVGELLAAVPEVLKEIPQVRFIFVGFGSFREHLEGMHRALQQGHAADFAACARAGEFVQTQSNSTQWFRHLSPRESSRITITGYLDHKVLSELLPLASLVIVSSKMAEAFGMIAVESMAAGVLPLCSYHSGLREVIDEVRLDLPDLGKNMILDPDKFFDELPVRIVAALKFLYPNGFSDHYQRRHVAETLRPWAVTKYSWSSIGHRLLDLKLI